MRVFTTIYSLRQHIQVLRKNHKCIGFVPTMGALHEGHKSLIEQSTEENDFTVCSIFVNPIQFNNAGDLKNYPNTISEDKAILENYDSIILFLPSIEEMYATKPLITFDFGDITKSMEGKYRPGHFNGVAIVVGRLFNIVQPDKAYFGQKDLQQCLVIKHLIKDLAFNIDLVVCPTVREEDGLALSSRNKRLNTIQRQTARHLPDALFIARNLVVKQENIEKIKSQVRQNLLDTNFKLEYFNIVNMEDLQDIQSYEGVSEVAIGIAGYVDDIRLLDNVIVKF